MSQEKLAAPELAAIDVRGVSRQSFIMRGAVAAGSVYGLAAVGPFVREAIAQDGGGDVDILNFGSRSSTWRRRSTRARSRRWAGPPGDARHWPRGPRDERRMSTRSSRRSGASRQARQGAWGRLGNAFSARRRPSDSPRRSRAPA